MKQTRTALSILPTEEDGKTVFEITEYEYREPCSGPEFVARFVGFFGYFLIVIGAAKFFIGLSYMTDAIQLIDAMLIAKNETGGGLDFEDLQQLGIWTVSMEVFTLILTINFVSNQHTSIVKQIQKADGTGNWKHYWMAFDVIVSFITGVFGLGYCTMCISYNYTILSKALNSYPYSGQALEILERVTAPIFDYSYITDFNPGTLIGKSTIIYSPH